MAKISYDFLLEWLRFDVWKEKHNESMTMGFGNAMPIAEDYSTEENNLLRACYILESGDTTRHVQFLIDVAFATENRDDGYGAGFRYRALRVLLSILDDGELEDLIKHDDTSRREYMHSLRYLDQLERLGLVYTLASFEKCCKHTLAQILLKNLSYMPRALSLIVQICMDYKIYDYLLLDETLERMVKLSMVKELREFIPIVGSTISMINSTGYTAGWQLLLAHPFSKLDARCTPEQLSDCVELLRFLYTCPIISKLDFKDVINQCFGCPKAVHLAAAFLPFLPENDRDWVMQKLKTWPDLPNVINRLFPLSVAGVLVTPQTIAILKATVADH